MGLVRRAMKMEASRWTSMEMRGQTRRSTCASKISSPWAEMTGLGARTAGPVSMDADRRLSVLMRVLQEAVTALIVEERGIIRARRGAVGRAVGEAAGMVEGEVRGGAEEEVDSMVGIEV